MEFDENNEDMLHEVIKAGDDKVREFPWNFGANWFGDLNWFQ